MSSSHNIYVAVVDDDESVCRSLSRLLRAAHFQPITYPSAEAFLADTKHPKFDCLLLDIQLRGMSGLDLSRRLSAVKDAPRSSSSRRTTNPRCGAGGGIRLRRLLPQDGLRR